MEGEKTSNTIDGENDVIIKMLEEKLGPLEDLQLYARVINTNTEDEDTDFSASDARLLVLDNIPMYSEHHYMTGIDGSGEEHCYPDQETTSIGRVLSTIFYNGCLYAKMQLGRTKASKSLVEQLSVKIRNGELRDVAMSLMAAVSREQGIERREAYKQKGVMSFGPYKSKDLYVLILEISLCKECWFPKCNILSFKSSS